MRPWRVRLSNRLASELPSKEALLLASSALSLPLVLPCASVFAAAVCPPCPPLRLLLLPAVACWSRYGLEPRGRAPRDEVRESTGGRSGEEVPRTFSLSQRVTDPTRPLVPPVAVAAAGFVVGGLLLVHDWNSCLLGHAACTWLRTADNL